MSPAHPPSPSKSASSTPHGKDGEDLEVSNRGGRRLSGDKRKRITSRTSVAYFCMEYGILEDFEIYCGGLGILAGDVICTANDLDMPLYGIGLFWSEGYTKQKVDKDGVVTDNYVKNNREHLKEENVEIEVTVEGKKIPLKAYSLKKVKNLFILEPAREADRWITERLYQGSKTDRIAQEIILGIGGVRLLRAMGISPDIYHFNEGHAVFAGLELMREAMEDKENPATFEEAWERTKNQVVFTTHTPVKAGNEEHEIQDLIKMNASTLTKAQLQKIAGSPFGMTVAGLRLSYVTNAVSQLHGETAKKMWKDVKDSSPIIAITNGVHKRWKAEAMVKAFEESTAEKPHLWRAHVDLKKELIAEIKRRTCVQLNVDNLVIGFARRSVTYKRSNLIFTKEKELEELLKKHKIQLVFSGKAHPQDESGKELIKKLVETQKKYPESVVYLECYDMTLGRLLTRGCDVWMNNPERPMEASGTSGMKAAANGVLNLSILDGWWPEGCTHGETGWQIGDESTAKNADERDATSLAKVIKEEVVPTYYDNRVKWEKMMYSSIAMAERFSSERMMEEYYEMAYSIKPKVQKKPKV